MELTYTEIALMIWAGIATAAAFKFKDEATIAKKILMIFINDEGARNQILEAHAKFAKFRDQLRERHD